MKTLRVIVLLALLVVVTSLSACGGQATPEAKPAEASTSTEQVKLNTHPASLEGKTVVLRWNSKPNGDKFLARLAENLTTQVPGIKIVRLWEDDPDTVVITEDTAQSETLMAKIAQLKPDLVIASQAD